MKKKLLLVLLIMMIGQVAYAEESASLAIDCGSNKVNIGDELTCNISLTHENVSVNTVEFNYDTDLNVTLNGEDGVLLTDSNGLVTIVSDKILDGENKTTDRLGSITINTNNLTSGNKTIKIKNIKISQDKETDKMYGSSDITKTISVVNLNELDKDCTLKTLTIDGTSVYGFSSSKDSYDVIVNSNLIYVDGKATSDKAVVSGLGNIYLPLDKPRKIVITVTAENGDKKDYTLTVTNKELSKDNNLKTLELYSGTKKFDFDYDPNKTSYNITIDDSTISKVTIKATLNDENASFVNKYGPRDITLNYGDNKAEVQVKSEYGTTKTYTLNITRKDDRDTDTTLSSLQINGENITLENDKYEYEIKVKYNVLKTEIKATANSEKAKVEYKDIDLSVGDNEVKIKVTAEKGDKKEYLVKIVRLSEEESKVLLENISIVNYSLPFKLDKETYDLDVEKNTKELKIVIAPENIEKEISGNENLSDGSKVTIKIKDDNGEKSYVINIHKPKDNSELMNIISYAVFGVGVILLITSIIVAIKRKKKRETLQ